MKIYFFVVLNERKNFKKRNVAIENTLIDKGRDSGLCFLPFFCLFLQNTSSQEISREFEYLMLCFPTLSSYTLSYTLRSHMIGDIRKSCFTQIYPSCKPSLKIEISKTVYHILKSTRSTLASGL